VRPRSAGGFSFIEMVTVVAIIAVVVSAAVPVPSSLYQRRRELFLRETLLLMRQGIRDFPTNLQDDDSDGELDEDPAGDQNRDGFPGIRGIDDNGDLRVDQDWRDRKPFLPNGSLDTAYDWRLRSDDDEDMSRDEEAYPTDLFDLVNRATILRGRIPRDPTTQQPAWAERTLRGSGAAAELAAANNDLDWSLTGFDPTQIGQISVPVVVSTDNTFQALYDVHLGPTGSSPPGPGAALEPLVDEDPRNGLDDDGDGRTDEDAADLTDIASLNSALSTNLTTYSSW